MVQQGLVNALQYSDRLVANNFLVVPVVLGKNGESSATLAAAQDKLTDGTGQSHVALPILMQVSRGLQRAMSGTHIATIHPCEGWPRHRWLSGGEIIVLC